MHAGPRLFARPFFLSLHSHRLALARRTVVPTPPSRRMDPEADTTAPRGRRGRGRGFRGRGRGRPRGQGRGRGAAILNGEDGPHYSEYESTARIEEIVDTDEVAPAEDVEVEGTPEETAEPDTGRGGRGRGRGRGRRGSWRRRRGRGRGGAPAEDGHVDADANTGEQATAGSESRPARQRRGRPPKQHLTHCAYSLVFTPVPCSLRLHTCSLVSSNRALTI